MQKILLSIFLLTATTQLRAQAIDLMSCFSGGFTYNYLDVTDTHHELIFSTRGNTMGLYFEGQKSPRFGREVSFAISKDDCDLSLVDDNIINCTTNKEVTFKIKTEDQGMIEETVTFVDIIMSKVPKHFHGLKLLVMTDRVLNRLLVSNAFTSCH